MVRTVWLSRAERISLAPALTMSLCLSISLSSVAGCGGQSYIMVAGNEGVVTEIDLRYTTLEKEAQTFLIPNSVLFTNSIGVVENKRRRMSEEPAA